MSHRYRRWLPWVLTLGALASLVMLPFLPAGGRPVHLSADADLATLSIQQRTTEHRYRFYLLVGDRIDGGELFASSDHGLDPRIANGIGGFRIVVADAYVDPLAIHPDEIMGEVVTANGNVPFSILDGPDTDRAWLAITPDGYVVVPDTVVPISVSEEAADG